jgi:hypothetical protein
MNVHDKLPSLPRALYQDINVGDAFNISWAGRTMDEVVPPSLRRPTLEAAIEGLTGTTSGKQDESVFAKQMMTCTVRDISSTGASLDATNFAEVPTDFTLVIEMETVERRCRVVCRRKTSVGLKFKPTWWCSPLPLTNCQHQLIGACRRY